MNCDQVQKKYKAYLLGKLPAQVRERIADHIRDCTDCFLMDQKENGLHLQETSAGEWAPKN
jgi:hypothetical protein